MVGRDDANQLWRLDRLDLPQDPGRLQGRPQPFLSAGRLVERDVEVERPTLKSRRIAARLDMLLDERHREAAARQRRGSAEATESTADDDDRQLSPRPDLRRHGVELQWVEGQRGGARRHQLEEVLAGDPTLELVTHYYLLSLLQSCECRPRRIDPGAAGPPRRAKCPHSGARASGLQ